MNGVYALAVWFSINGQPTAIEGYAPLPMPSQEYCEIRKEYMEKYYENIRVSSGYTAPDYYVFCTDGSDIEGHRQKAAEKFKQSDI